MPERVVDVYGGASAASVARIGCDDALVVAGLGCAGGGAGRSWTAGVTVTGAFALVFFADRSEQLAVVTTKQADVNTTHVVWPAVISSKRWHRALRAGPWREPQRRHSPRNA